MRSTIVRGALLLALGLATAGGCGQEERGDVADGEPCTSARQCRHGYCVGGMAGEDPVCTRSCSSTSECPRGWACSGVTEDDVLICTQGAPTPFGIGARE